jgi:hypothetical protein
MNRFASLAVVALLTSTAASAQIFIPTYPDPPENYGASPMSRDDGARAILLNSDLSCLQIVIGGQWKCLASKQQLDASTAALQAQMATMPAFSYGYGSAEVLSVTIPLGTNPVIAAPIIIPIPGAILTSFPNTGRCEVMSATVLPANVTVDCTVTTVGLASVMVRYTGVLGLPLGVTLGRMTARAKVTIPAT